MGVGGQLTQLDQEHSGGGDELERVCSHTLVVARVGGVQVLDAQLGAGVRPADGDAPLLLQEGRVVLQPLDAGPRVPPHPAVQRGRLALEVGDVVDRFLELQEEPCADRQTGGKASPAWMLEPGCQSRRFSGGLTLSGGCDSLLQRSRGVCIQGQAGVDCTKHRRFNSRTATTTVSLTVSGCLKQPPHSQATSTVKAAAADPLSD